MNFDLTGGLVPFEVPSDSAPSARGAGSASAGPAPLGGEAGSASPLSFFGDMIQQIGRSMTADPASGAPAGANATNASAQSPQSMHEAIDLLESVIGMMSLYGSSDDMMARLQSGDLPKLDTL